MTANTVLLERVAPHLAGMSDGFVYSQACAASRRDALR